MYAFVIGHIQRAGFKCPHYEEDRRFSVCISKNCIFGEINPLVSVTGIMEFERASSFDKFSCLQVSS